MPLLVSVIALMLAALEYAASGPPFPGVFVRYPAIEASVAARECVALGDDMFDDNVSELGTCHVLALHGIGSAGGASWMYGTYERRWLPAPNDTVVEREVVLFRKASRDGSTLQPVWHYRYEAALLVSATPQVATARGAVVLLSVDECFNGTGGCGQSFVLLARGSPTPVTLAFLDSLDRRFPGAIRHGFHVDLRTLRGSLGLYSGSDANCCPSTVGDFVLRLRGNSLEIATLKLRRAD